MTLQQELAAIELNQDLLEAMLENIAAGGPGSGCHGDNCGRPPGPGHDAPQGAPGEKKADTTGTLMKKFGWEKVKHGTGPEVMVKGQPATTYYHPTHGVINVTKNWYEHYQMGQKVGEKTDLAKGTPLSEKLKKYLKEATPRPGHGLPKVVPVVEKPAAKVPEVGKPIEKPVPPPAWGPKPISNFDHAYEFKNSGSGLGGAHDKYVFRNKMSGQDYLFKPALTLGGTVMPMMARADQLAGSIGKLIRPNEAISAQAVKLTVPGRGEMIGSVQSMVPNLKTGGDKDFKLKDPISLTGSEVKALQQEQVTDWLVSNHDSHGGQFLRAQDGKVYGIDKSQAFKFFGKDKLSTDYQPNTETHGEAPPYYNGMFKAIKEGKLPFNPNDTLPAIKNAEAIPDYMMRDILLPYALERYKDLPAANQFIDDVTDRKNNIRKDFEAFYSNVLGKPFKFAGKAPQPEPSVVIPPAPTIAPTTMKVPVKNLDKSLNTPINLPAMKAPVADATDLVNKYKKETYPGYYGATKDAWNSSAIYEWRRGIEDGESSVEAAKGLGAYPELAAKMGVNPKDLEDMHQDLNGWVGSADSKGGLRVQESFQEILNGQCCSTGLRKAYMVEYAMTQAKLKAHHPDGTVKVYRGVGGKHAMLIEDTAKKYDVVSIKTRGAESYSTSRNVAKGFATGYDNGVVITEPALPIEHVLTTHHTHKDVFAGMTEEEYVVGFPSALQKVASNNVKVVKRNGSYVDDYSAAASDEEEEKELTISPTIDLADDDEQHDWIHIQHKKKNQYPDDTEDKDKE